jgi:hypothetical protein
MEACASCSKPLTLQIELDEDEVPTAGSSSNARTHEVPDDVQLLNCGCHFHWQCILDAYEVTRCPHCSKDISSTDPSGETQILCNLLNEGGIQERLDILPVLSEELYLKAYPDDRKPRAFLEFCREGDIEAIVDLLKATDEDDEDENEDMDEDMDEGSESPIDAATVLRYQDPIGEMQSALHLAVISSKASVVWLLLLLASNLEPQHFPAEVKTAAEQLGISREDQNGKVDIRTLKDGDGKIAAQYVQDSLGIDARLLSADG